MKKILDVSLEDISGKELNYDPFLPDLVILETHGAQRHLIRNDLLPVRINGYSLVLVLRGEMTISLNYQLHRLVKNEAIELLNHHIIESVEVSSDFKAYHLIVGKDFFDGMVKHTAFPMLDISMANAEGAIPLEADQMDRLAGMVDNLRSYIHMKEHRYRINMVQSALSLVLLEFGDLAYSHMKGNEEKPHDLNRQKKIVTDFVQLLVQNCQKESEVVFYSTQLCITPEYLSRLIKSFSGKPVKVWIKEARLAQAKILLRRPDTSVQEVADELGFSDQSAFGKFFRKMTGISPAEYRRAAQHAYQPLA